MLCVCSHVHHAAGKQQIATRSRDWRENMRQISFDCTSSALELRSPSKVAVSLAHVCYSMRRTLRFPFTLPGSLAFFSGANRDDLNQKIRRSSFCDTMLLAMPLDACGVLPFGLPGVSTALVHVFHTWHRRRLDVACHDEKGRCNAVQQAVSRKFTRAGARQAVHESRLQHLVPRKPARASSTIFRATLCAPEADAPRLSCRDRLPMRPLNECVQPQKLAMPGCSFGQSMQAN